uniref:Secreted protein n=1 Tax=Steinernema glaseri TaxID=37863 RepID=A0A1I8AIA3_9BILA
MFWNIAFVTLLISSLGLSAVQGAGGWGDTTMVLQGETSTPTSLPPPNSFFFRFTPKNVTQEGVTSSTVSNTDL